MNKCNITSFVLSKISALKNGQYCINESNILDNYIDFTDCIERATCFGDNCDNPTLFIPCTISITGMVREIEEDMANIFMVDGNIINGAPPYTYEWDFDEASFDLVSGKYESVLVIALKEGKTFDTIVSPVTCIIIDTLGCKTTKTCYITPSGMHCETNYSYCPNPIELGIKNKQVYCPKPMGLIIHKKS